MIGGSIHRSEAHHIHPKIPHIFPAGRVLKFIGKNICERSRETSMAEATLSSSLPQFPKNKAFTFSRDRVPSAEIRVCQAYL